MLAQSEVSTATVRAVGRVSQHDQRWLLDLEVELPGHRATRKLEAPECATLSETAAWLVSVAVDPNLAPPPPPPPQPPPAPAEPVAPPAPPPVVAPVAKTAPKPAQEPAADSGETKASAPSPGWRIGLLTGVFSTGLVGPTGTLGAEVGVDIHQLSLGLSFAHQFERSKTLRVPGVSVGFSAQELGLAGCYEWGDTVRVGPCALAAVLRTQGRIYGATAEHSDAFLWGTAGAGLVLRYREFSPFEVALNAGIWAPISARPRFDVTGLGSVGEAAAVGGHVRLGLSLRLP
jgi:hypothetical protein